MSAGSKPHHVRGISDQTWEAYEAACKILNGDGNRSADMRWHILDTIARAGVKIAPGSDEETAK